MATIAERKCEICQQSPFKYRCPACETRSCSLPCFNTHKSSCTGAKQDSGDATIEEAKSTANVSPDLTARKELDQMFQQYPRLRDKLDAIYQETLDPKSRRDPIHQSRNSRFENRWTEEKGFEQGLRILKAKLAADSPEQEDLRAFAAFVSNRSENV